MARRALNTQEIASFLGLSRATVSNVINGKGRVSAETRKRVEEFVRASGYVRDRNAVALRTQKSRLVGVLVTTISNPFYGSVVSDIELRLRQSGYTTILAQAMDDTEHQSQLLEELVGSGVSGLIVVPSARTVADDLLIATQRRIPTVLFVRDIVGSDFPMVSLDDHAAGVLLARHMAEAGYRDLVFIGGAAGTTTLDRRRDGVNDGLREHGLRGVTTYHGPIDEQFGYQQTKEILTAGSAIDGIVGHNDLVALGCMRALHEFGRAPGSEIGVAGFDNLFFGMTSNPTLTTVDVRLSSLGFEAADKLLQLIDTPEVRLGSLKMTPALIARDSTKK